MGMCGDDPDDGSAQLRADEDAKNARIREGTNRINTVFGGNLSTQAPKYKSVVDNRQNVSGPGGYGLVPNPNYGKSHDVPDGMQDVVTSAVPGQFDDSFYNNLEKTYSDYYAPQLKRQEGDADRSLKIGLSRTGNLDSSYGAKMIGRLAEDKGVQDRALVDNSLNFSATARKKNEDTRANLIGQLENGAGVENVASQATAAADASTAPPAFSPLGDLFKNYTSAVANASIASTNPAAFPGADQYKNSLLFNIPSSSGGGSSSVVR